MRIELLEYFIDYIVSSTRVLTYTGYDQLNVDLSLARRYYMNMFDNFFSAYIISLFATSATEKEEETKKENKTKTNLC